MLYTGNVDLHWPLLGKADFVILTDANPEPSSSVEASTPTSTANN